MVVDYTSLMDLLGEKNWQAADVETRRLMLSIAGADRRSDLLLTATDIQEFPCTELVTIDNLWVMYSEGHFGFTVIKRIYDEEGKDYSQLAERVGWRVGEKWIKYEEVNFTGNAPVGHLPITWLVPSSFGMYWLARFASPGWRLLLERAEACQLS